MKKKLTVTKIFNASVEEVWKIWTEPEYVKQWWGTDKFARPTAKIDFRKGGVSLVAMKALKELGGEAWYIIWEYKKIVPMKSIEYIQNSADENGNKRKPAEVGMPNDFPEDVRTVVTFKTITENKTEMTVTQYADLGQMALVAKISLERSLDKATTIFV